MAHITSTVALLGAGAGQAVALQMKAELPSIGKETAAKCSGKKFDLFKAMPATAAVKGDKPRTDVVPAEDATPFEAQVTKKFGRPLVQLNDRVFCALGELVGELGCLRDGVDVEGTKKTLDSALEAGTVTVKPFGERPQTLALVTEQFNVAATARWAEIAAELNTRKAVTRTVNRKQLQVSTVEGMVDQMVDVTRPVNMAQGGPNGCGKGWYFSSGKLQESVRKTFQLEIPKDGPSWYNPQLDVEISIVAKDYLETLRKYCLTIADPLQRFAEYWTVKAELWGAGPVASPARKAVDAFCQNAESQANTSAASLFLSKWTETTWEGHPLALGILPGVPMKFDEDAFETKKFENSLFKHYNKLLVVYTTTNEATLETASMLALGRMAKEMTSQRVFGGVNVSLPVLSAINKTARDVTTKKLETMVQIYNSKVVEKNAKITEKDEQFGYAFLHVVDMDEAKMCEAAWVDGANVDWQTYLDEAQQPGGKSRYAGRYVHGENVDDLNRRADALNYELDTKVTEKQLLTKEDLAEWMDKRMAKREQVMDGRIGKMEEKMSTLVPNAGSDRQA